MSALSPADLELLSAYLDDELPPAERAALERRLAADAALRAELEALRQVVRSVRAMPVLTAPRDFRLDPAVYGQGTRPRRIALPGRQPRRSYYGWASALSAVAALIVLTLGLVSLTGPRLTGERMAVRVNSLNAGQSQEAGAPAAAIASAPTVPVTAMAEELSAAPPSESESQAAEGREGILGEAVPGAPPPGQAEGMADSTVAGQPGVQPPLAAQTGGEQGMAAASPVGFAAGDETQYKATLSVTPTPQPGMGGGGVAPTGAAAAARAVGSLPTPTVPVNEGIAAEQGIATPAVVMPADALAASTLPTTPIAVAPTSTAAPTLAAMPTSAPPAPQVEAPAAEQSSRTGTRVPGTSLILLGAGGILLALAAVFFAFSRRGR